MRRYFVIAGSVIVLLGVVGALTGLFATFHAKDWTTAALSAAAIVVAGASLIRTAVPQPHWSVEFDVGTSPDSTRGYLRANATQNGPGVAERVGEQTRTPKGKWSDPDFPTWDSWLHVRGGEGVTFDLAQGPGIPAGRYQLRVLYRSLPDTWRLRRKTFSYDYKPSPEEKPPEKKRKSDHQIL